MVMARATLNCQSFQTKTERMKTMLKLSSPWQIYYHKINALFAQDPEVNVVFDDAKYELKLFVDNPIKADAIAKLLPVEQSFGNVTIKVTVIPANKDSIGDVFRAAFNKNPALRYVADIDTPMTGKLSCVVFQNRVVQFFADNMLDINGVISTLYQDIAKDVLVPDELVSYSTDIVEGDGVPF